uniref:regulatory protein RecX n=1 Tax=uncultured Micrococcus sp. TaxID=114051 RepID=UPI00260BEF10|nr:regulatory protein RecX [uncultured Micrococcus sp.]
MSGHGAGFDDSRDSEVARLWLDLAGLDPAAASPAEPAPPEPAALSALLTRASDLPSPAPTTGGVTPLPWTSGAGTVPGPTTAPGTKKRRAPKAAAPSSPPAPEPEPSVVGRSAEASDEAARPRRRRRPGPAPLPEDPRERAEAAREVVLRQLAMGPRSRGQLERKLAEREAEPELIEQVLDRFEEVRLVDDAAFAEVWVRSRHRGRGLSRRAIGRELQEKGVDRDVAEEALEAIEPEDERAAALELARRRMRGKTVPPADSPENRAERDKVVRRLVGMLGRKGYAPGLAFGVVTEVLGEHEADAS